jgi:hypothetical protein
MNKAAARAAGLKAWTATDEEKSQTRKSAAQVYDGFSTGLGLAAPFLPPPTNLMVGAGSVVFKSMSWLLDPPTSGAVLYEIGALAAPGAGSSLKYARAEFEFQFAITAEFLKPAIVPKIDSMFGHCLASQNCR